LPSEFPSEFAVNDSSANERVDLQKIQAEFQEVDARDRLAMLLEFAETLPELPQRYHAKRDAGENRIHECQSPVFMWVEVVDGHVEIYADVPRSAPTVRGFIGLLVAALSGASPAEILGLPPTLLQQLGLLEALGMLRMRGLQAILHRLKTSVAAAVAKT
jgi:cysteine desulfuration protein SufE